MELISLFPSLIRSVFVQPQLYYQAKDWTSLLFVLKKSVLFKIYLSDLFGTDFSLLDLKSKVNVQLTFIGWSYQLQQTIKIQTSSFGVTSSLTPLWSSSNWFERELWEMLGIYSVGHPDLRRLLTDYGFQGRPLLKDFPLTGYLELIYSEKYKRVISRSLNLTQEFRSFDFQTPWQK